MKHESVTVAIITVFCEFEVALLVVIPTLESLIVGSDVVEISEEVTGTTFVIKATVFIATGFIPANAVPELPPVTLLKLTSPFIRLRKFYVNHIVSSENLSCCTHETRVHKVSTIHIYITHFLFKLL